MPQDEGREFVAVEIAGGRYAFPVESIREVLLLVEPTAVPAWPSSALGMVNLRGEMVPLIDVASALGRPPSRLHKDQCILVGWAFARVCAILVDRVDGVRPLVVREDPAAAPPPPEAGNLALCLGIAVDAEGPLVVLDLAGVLKSAGLGERAALSVPG